VPARAVEATAGGGRDRAVTTLTLDRAIAEYLDHLAVERGLADATIRAYRADLEDFSATLVWFPVDTDVARIGGALARRYRPSHGRLEDTDYLIGATALLLDAELLTTNVKHFPMLEGLRAAY